MEMSSKYLFITFNGNFKLSFVSKASLLIGILIDIAVFSNQRRCKITKNTSTTGPTKMTLKFLQIVIIPVSISEQCIIFNQEKTYLVSSKLFAYPVNL